jgi:hypothetical protein
MLLPLTVSMYSPFGAAFLAAGRDIALVISVYVLSLQGVVCPDVVSLLFDVVACRSDGELKVKARPLKRVSTCTSLTAQQCRARRRGSIEVFWRVCVALIAIATC